jgi:hypothetical protein
MHACVIIHNMIIETERANPEASEMTFESQGPLAEVDHEVLAEFGAFISMLQEIHDKQVHLQVYDDLVEHICARKGNAR